MAITDYTSLQAAVLSFNWGRDTGSVQDFVQLAHTRINLGLRVPFMQKTASLTIDANRVAAPTDMAAPVRLWIDGSQEAPLVPTSPDRILALRATYGETSQPGWFAIEGDTTAGSENATEGEYFTFAPGPGATTYTGLLLYTRRLAALSSGGDTNIVLTRYPNLYLYGALDEAGAYSDDARTYGQRFQILLEQINMQARLDAYGGGSPQPTSPYAV